VCFIVACNSGPVLATSLLASPDLAAGVEVVVERGAVSAAQAYNRGMEKTRADVLVFVHQDVFLPPGWLAHFQAALLALEATDPGWGVLGLVGVVVDGARRGWLYSTGLGRILGGPFALPQPVRTLDEVLLVLRRTSGLRFDEALPGFHLYGTDICLEAEKLGRSNYVLSCFALHNSNGIKYLPRSFWDAYRFLRRKWWKELPVESPCAVISRSGLPFVKGVVRGLYFRFFQQGRVGQRVQNPGELFQTIQSRNVLCR
jgi:glycosyltransferase involved in cell wall biosynthesis